MSVGKKSDPQRLIHRWSASDDIWHILVFKDTLSHSLLFNFYCGRGQGSHFFFTFLGLSFLLPARFMFISWSVFISRALFPVYRSLKSRPLNYNQIPRHITEVLTLRIILLCCQLVTVCIFLVKSSCQTAISDLELRFQDVNYLRIKSITEIRGKVCAGREIAQVFRVIWFDADHFRLLHELSFPFSHSLCLINHRVSLFLPKWQISHQIPAGICPFYLKLFCISSQSSRDSKVISYRQLKYLKPFTLQNGSVMLADMFSLSSL